MGIIMRKVLLACIVLFLDTCGSNSEENTSYKENNETAELTINTEETLDKGMQADEDKQSSTEEELETEESAAEEPALQEDASEEEPQEQNNFEEANPENKEEEIESSEWDDLKENIVGKSDKDASEIISSKPSDVRNDTTKNWKKNTISESVDTFDYTLSYHDEYMAEGEIHFIVNFAYNTTTTLNYMNGLLFVDIHEYRDGEEHDASSLGSGMLLQSYIIYPDGDIEEIEI